MSCVENGVIAPQSFCHLMSCRNLLGLLGRRSTFLDGLETESGIPASIWVAVAGVGEWLEHSPLTSCQPNFSDRDFQRTHR